MIGSGVARAFLGPATLAVCFCIGSVARFDEASAADAVVEETQPLSAAIGGRDEQLETLVVHPAGPGRFPIALIANGHFADPTISHPSDLAHLAHDFAHRGWLAAVVNWPGYGLSSGALQEKAGTCTAPNPKEYLDAHAADLSGALAALRARADADPTIAVGLGISIGGASMLDLAAQADHPLTAVVDISGGLYHNAKPFMPDPACGAFEAELVRTVGTFGTAHVPTLWIYAENDPWFRPDLVRRMAEAYREDGGTVDLEMLPPFRDNGHMLFLWEANVLTQPLIDQFLRANRLPAMAGDEAFAALRSTLGPDDRDMLAYYLRMPAEKALAVPQIGSGAYVGFAKRSVDAARQEALSRCEAASREKCHVAAENQTVAEP